MAMIEANDLMPAIVAAHELLMKKSKDYNGEEVPIDHAREEYFPYGAVSYLQMIYTKFKRLEQVLMDNRETNFESAEDSCLDLINYSAFLYSYLDNQRSKGSTFDLDLESGEIHLK